MTADLIAQITALLDRWDAQAQDAAIRITTTELPSMGGFYMGVTSWRLLLRGLIS